MSRDRTLPIFEVEEALVKALTTDEQARAIIEAPTGSGKSTQIPQMLIDRGMVAPDREVVVLQPRRIAARMLARRVASERNGRLGDEVGYQVRFESALSERTRIRYITEGILLRQLLSDPNLSGVGAVVFDEFHERHFFGDVTLARCLQVQETRRPDLKLVVMSATLEAVSLSDYLGEKSVVISSQGRTYPVDLRYVPPKQRQDAKKPGDQIARTLQDWYRQNGVDGHALVFLPGAFEIRQAQRALENSVWVKKLGLRILPLFGELDAKAQDAAVEPSATPKIVLSTNVAETSLTIDGVRLVVDSGLERRASFDDRRGIETLTIEKISRASADQRAGRAGRTGPGVCLRLWSAEDHGRREPATPAEIHRMDLSEAVLFLKAGGIIDLWNFPWFEAPDRQALERATAWLQTLGALDAGGELLTPLGNELSKLPINPRYGRVLLEATRHGCLEFFAVAAAASQTRPLFPAKKRVSTDLSLADFVADDHLSDYQALCRAWREAQAVNFDHRRCSQLGMNANAARDIARIAKQFLRSLSRSVGKTRQDIEPDGDLIGRILLCGFPDRVAKRLSSATLACAVVGGRRGMVSKGCRAAERDAGLFLAGEMIEVEGKDVSVRLNLTTLIEEAWLREFFPDQFIEVDGAVYDDTTRRVEARRERRFRDLVIESKLGGEIDPAKAAQLLAQQVFAGNLVLKRWDRDVEQWLARVNTLAESMPELGVPMIDDDARLLLFEEICAGATGYKQIKDRPVKDALHAWLPPHQVVLLDKWVPERVTLANGKSAKVTYEPGSKPKISMMIQHLFGVMETPTLPGGRVPLVVEILGPNSRPVQVTENLGGFWKGSYGAVRTQLRGRYPKHEWPEY